MIQLQIRVGFSSWRAGSGQGAAYVIIMLQLCAHVSPFPEEVKGLLKCLLFLLLVMTLFYFCKFCLVLFQVGCVHFLMVSCPLKDLSILRFISVNEESLTSLLDLLSI